MNLGGRIGASTNTFISDLSVFCIDSITTCLSLNADKVCVPIGLGALSALLLLLSCCLIMYQRRKVRGESKGQVAACSMYGFLGNLCSIIGAILSQQLAIQILMGAFAAAMDVVNFISIFFPLCWYSKAERRLRMMRRRRRQYLLAMCVLMVLGGGYLTSRVSPSATDGPFTGRRLLHALLQDNTHILGYILGLLSFVIACTAKFPAISRAVSGRETVKGARVFSGTLCSLAGILYASAILLCDTRFEYVVKAMPWLLSAMCCAALDLKKNAKKKTEMGHYMDVNVQPARKVCLKEVPVSRDGALESQPLAGKVRVVRVGGLCSSDTSYDSSSVSSDLEWDFEEANTQWRESPAKQEIGDEFPLQEWPKNPAPFGICTCGISGLPEKIVCGKEMGQCGSDANIDQ
ncbi:transmembrane protein 44 [Polymixia lowei]